MRWIEETAEWEYEGALRLSKKYGLGWVSPLTLESGHGEPIFSLSEIRKLVSELNRNRREVEKAKDAVIVYSVYDPGEGK